MCLVSSCHQSIAQVIYKQKAPNISVIDYRERSTQELMEEFSSPITELPEFQGKDGDKLNVNLDYDVVQLETKKAFLLLQ